MPTLTAVTLPQYKPNAKRREIRDSGAPGLYLIIQPKPTGTRSWVLRYRDARGKSVKWCSVQSISPATPTGLNDTPQVGEPHTLADARVLAATL